MGIQYTFQMSFNRDKTSPDATVYGRPTRDLSATAFQCKGCSKVTWGEFFGRLLDMLEDSHTEAPHDIASEEFYDKFVGQFIYFDDEDGQASVKYERYKSQLKHAMHNSILHAFAKPWSHNIYILEVTKVVIAPTDVVFKQGYHKKSFKTVLSVLDELSIYWHFGWGEKEHKLNHVIHSTKITTLLALEGKLTKLMDEYEDNEEFCVELLVGLTSSQPQVVGVVPELKKMYDWLYNMGRIQ